MKVAAPWPPLRNLFAVDDGSLPEIRVTGLSRQAVQYAYWLVQSAASVDSDASFCRVDSEREEKVHATRNAAELVAEGSAHPFHFLARNVVIEGVELPEIGVFISSDEVALDYRS